MDREFNFPRAKYGWRANAVLAAGLVLILVGIFLMVKHSEHATKVFALRPVILLSVGAIALFVSIAFTESGNTLYVGLFCVMMGIVMLMVDTHIIRYSLKEMWPTIMISSGVALFPASLYKLRRIRTVYLFPAIMLIMLGMMFLLFSMHIFPFSFREFISKWWPLLVIMGGFLLIAIFFVQRANSKRFPYMKDDSLVEGDE